MATQQRYGVTLLLALLMAGTASCGGGGETDSTVTASTQADQPLGATSPTPVSEPDSIEHAIQAVMTSGDIPSLAAAIAVGNEVVWAHAFGEQDDLETVYMIGSIEKVFVAMSVLQLVEEGLVDLAADVNEYLPFAVRNPDHPDTPVRSSCFSPTRPASPPIPEQNAGLPPLLSGWKAADHSGKRSFRDRGHSFGQLCEHLQPGTGSAGASTPKRRRM